MPFSSDPFVFFTAIALGNLLINENVPGAVVGSVAVEDPDSGDTHNLTVSDPRFEFIGSQLKLKGSVQLDHESLASVRLTVTATDTGVPALASSRSFTIQIADVNEAPVDVRLSQKTGNESQAGATVGVLSVIDPDRGDSHTFTVSDDRFEVSKRRLKLKPDTSLDYDSETSVTLRVTATDSGNQAVSKDFVISVVDSGNISCR